MFLCGHCCILSTHSRAIGTAVQPTCHCVACCILFNPLLFMFCVRQLLYLISCQVNWTGSCWTLCTCSVLLHPLGSWGGACRQQVRRLIVADRSFRCRPKLIECDQSRFSFRRSFLFGMPAEDKFSAMCVIFCLQETIASAFVLGLY